MVRWYKLYVDVIPLVLAATGRAELPVRTRKAVYQEVHSSD